MKTIERKVETNPFEELVQKLQEKRGVHLCHVKNGTIQESLGRHTIGEIESAGGMNIISITREDLWDFLKIFLAKKRERDELEGHISFKTENKKITIYGGPRTKEIIESSSELQTMSLVNEDVGVIVEEVRESIASV